MKARLRTVTGLKGHLRVAAVAAGLAGAVALAPGANAAPIGFVTSIEGIGQVQAAGNKNWAPAALDAELSVGDALRTQRNSQMRALLVDDTTLALGARTELVLDRLVVGDLATRERSILRQTRGQVRAHVGQAFGGTTRIEIHTPTAILGVKGSILEVMVRFDAGGNPVTTAVCVEGSCFARNADPKVSGEVDLPAGLATVIRRGKAPSAPAKPGPDYVPLGAGPATTTAGASDDALLFGDKSAGQELAESTEGNQLDSQAADITNSTGQSVGVEEAFEGGENPPLGGGLGTANSRYSPDPPGLPDPNENIKTIGNGGPNQQGRP